MPTRTGELVSLAVSGDKKAFEELFINNFSSAYFPAYGLLRDKQEAMKITLSCFANAFKNLSNLSKPDSFEDWIKQITVKKCIETMKKRGVLFSGERPLTCRVEIDGSYEFLPIESLNSKDLMHLIMNTVDSMPVTQRSCVYLCYYSGYSVSAIAKLLSCMDIDVKAHLYVSREQIKKAVDSKIGSFTELSRMNGTSILSLVMEDMKKAIPVGQETIRNYFAVIYEKAGLSSENKQKPAVQTAPAVAVAPIAVAPAVTSASADPFDFLNQDDSAVQTKPAVPVAPAVTSASADPFDFFAQDNSAVQTKSAVPVASAVTSASADSFDFFAQDDSAVQKKPAVPVASAVTSASADPFDFFAQDNSAVQTKPAVPVAPAVTSASADSFDFFAGDSQYMQDNAQNTKKTKPEKSGNKTPVIIAVVVILILAVAAAVAAWFIFGNESNLPFLSDDVTFSDEYNDYYNENEQTEQTEPENIKLAANESDYINLTDFLNNIMTVVQEYDSSSRDAKRNAYNVMFLGWCGGPIYREFFGEPEYIEPNTDPLDKFSSSVRIIVYPERNIDWIIRNVFSVEPDHNYDSSTVFGNKGYYYDGYYYVLDDSQGDISRKFEVVRSVQDSDEIYTVTMRYLASGPEDDGYSYIATLNIKAALKENAGRRYWSLYKMEYDDSDADVVQNSSSTEQTTVNSKDYMSAYNKYLKNFNNGEYKTGQRFELVYLNDDEIPELFVKYGGAHFDSVTVLTYADGEIVEIGEYGTYGQLNYVERESIVLVGNMHMGYQSGSILRLNLEDGTEERLFTHYDNEGAASDESELFYQINDKNVSKKEYEKAVEENMNIETSVFYEGIHMTTENIDKYCSD